MKLTQSSPGIYAVTLDDDRPIGTVHRSRNRDGWLARNADGENIGRAAKRAKALELLEWHDAVNRAAEISVEQ